MKIKVIRYSDNGESTLGLLFVDEKFFCYTLEDTHRDVKVKHQTRIPAGKYLLSVVKNETPLTLQYRRQYPWFKNHIEITGVKNFSGVYIHIGNHKDHTSGCILVGNEANNNTVENGFIRKSTAAFMRLYTHIYDQVEKGGVYIEIKDIKL